VRLRALWCSSVVHSLLILLEGAVRYASVHLGRTDQESVVARVSFSASDSRGLLNSVILFREKANHLVRVQQHSKLERSLAS